MFLSVHGNRWITARRFSNSNICFIKIKIVTLDGKQKQNCILVCEVFKLNTYAFAFLWELCKLCLLYYREEYNIIKSLKSQKILAKWTSYTQHCTNVKYFGQNFYLPRTIFSHLLSIFLFIYLVWGWLAKIFNVVSYHF